MEGPAKKKRGWGGASVARIDICCATGDPSLEGTGTCCMEKTGSLVSEQPHIIIPTLREDVTFAARTQYILHPTTMEQGRETGDSVPPDLPHCDRDMCRSGGLKPVACPTWCTFLLVFRQGMSHAVGGYSHRMLLLRPSFAHVLLPLFAFSSWLCYLCRKERVLIQLLWPKCVLSFGAKLGGGQNQDGKYTKEDHWSLLFFPHH